MGMGEPLDNLEHLVRAIRVMSHFPGLGIKNITVSTVGLAPQVYSLLLALTLILTLTLTLTRCTRCYSHCRACAWPSRCTLQMTRRARG